MCHYDARRPFPCIRKQPVRPGPVCRVEFEPPCFFFSAKQRATPGRARSQQYSHRHRQAVYGPCVYLRVSVCAIVGPGPQLYHQRVPYAFHDGRDIVNSF